MSDLPTNEAESPDDPQINRDPQPSTSPTVKRTGLESLPNEVLVDIMRYCEPEDMTSMAWSLCLVSRRMEPVARQELYSRVAIATFRNLSSLCRALEQKPVLGQYIAELNLVVPTAGLEPIDISPMPMEASFQLLWSLYFEVLRHSPGIKQLAMMLTADAHNDILPWGTYQRFIDRLSETIKRSQRTGSATAILPRLEQFRLINETQTRDWLYREIFQSKILKPFLHLPSLSGLEVINDAGSWVDDKFPYQSRGSSTTAVRAASPEQVKSMVLRESNCNPTDVMSVVTMFPAIEVLFVQQGPKQAHDRESMVDEAIAAQMKAEESKKRYLSDSFEKLQKLNTFAYIPHSDRSGPIDRLGPFLGPSNFLSLKDLPNLTSVSILMNLFTSPSGFTNGRLTASPLAVLPRSLKSLHVIVDVFRRGTLLSEAWLHPRLAALGFMEELASFCRTEFPSLRRVEYIWAVNRTQRQFGVRDYRGLLPRNWIMRTPCDGSIPLCCSMHGRIQALSPDVEFTSMAEGIISPSRDRFDSLKLAFENVDVTFKVIELQEYSDFFHHWQQSQE